MNNKIEISQEAQEQIFKLMPQHKANFFRITVQGGGCAGFQYKFDFDNNKNDNDILLKTEKISILIDTTSLELIKGSKLDYTKELIGSSFKLSNPQATSSCGCGTSFSI